jgi:hypothetical protein
VELVERIYAAWARGELPGPSGLLDPKIENVNPPDDAFDAVGPPA